MAKLKTWPTKNTFYALLEKIVMSVLCLILRLSQEVKICNLSNNAYLCVDWIDLDEKCLRI
jgi:hypothetical protein